MKCGNIIASTKNDQHSSTNDRNSMFQNVGANTPSVIDSNFSHFCKSSISYTKKMKLKISLKLWIKTYIMFGIARLYNAWRNIEICRSYAILFQQQVDKLIDQARFPFYI